MALVGALGAGGVLAVLTLVFKRSRVPVHVDVEVGDLRELLAAHQTDQVRPLPPVFAGEIIVCSSIVCRLEEKNSGSDSLPLVVGGTLDHVLPEVV